MTKLNKLMNNTGIFFSTVDRLYTEFDSAKSRDQIFNESVEIRLKSVLELQSKYFDEELEKLENTLNWDLSNVSNIRHVSQILKGLYKIIACDRMSIINSLISICEVE